MDSSSSWGRHANPLPTPRDSRPEGMRRTVTSHKVDFLSTSYLLECVKETEESDSAFASSLFPFSFFWDQLCASDSR